MSDIQNTVMVTAAILTGSFFSYLLQFFLGRNLSVPDYGSFNALLSVGAVVAVPASVVGTALIKEVSSLYAKKETARISALFYQTLIWSSALGLIIFGFFYIFPTGVFNWLKITESNLILSFTIYLALTFLTSIPYYYLQGLLQYKVFSILVVVSNVLRFVLPAVYILQTKNLANVFDGLVFSLVFSFIFGLLLLKKHLIKVSDFTAWKELLSIIKFSLPVMLVNLCLISFNNSDVILVRSYIGGQLAGYYAGVVTVGKILLFGALPVGTVMYPKISALKSSGDDIKKVFNKFLRMQLGVVGLGLVIFMIFPKLIALAFFGHKYLESVKYLPLYALFVTLYVILNFLILFLLAVDITKIYMVLIGIAFGQILLITNIHTDLYRILLINFSVMLLAVGYVSFRAYSFLKNH